jgi:Zn-dependent protease
MIKIQSKSTLLTFHFTFFAAVTIMVLLKNSQIAIMGLCACLIHEFGHVIACKVCKVSIEEIEFCCTGLCIRKLDKRNLTYSKELLILSSGIITNLFITAFFLVVPINEGKLFATVNMAIAVFNLLPLTNFDGYQIRELLVARLVTLEKISMVRKTLKIADIILFVIVMIAILTLSNFNIGVLIIPMALILIGKFEDR